jgi:hypothetical protein
MSEFKSTMAERLALAKSDSATTYHSQAAAQIALENTGRFAALGQQAKPSVVGAEPVIQYPGAAVNARREHAGAAPRFLGRGHAASR